MRPAGEQGVQGVLGTQLCGGPFEREGRRRPRKISAGSGNKGRLYSVRKRAGYEEEEGL